RVVVIDRGSVQQVDQPMAVYQRPWNRFVAGVIGWPTMKFVDGKIILKTRQVWLSSSDWTLPLEQTRFDESGFPQNAKGTVGIRPEHVRIGATRPDEARLTMEVVLVEPLGHEWLVTLQRDGWQVTARAVDQQELENKQAVEVGFAMEQVHLFDTATGLALSQG